MTETVWQLLVVVTSAMVLLEGLVLIGVLRHLGTGLIGSGSYGDVNEGPVLGTLVEIEGFSTGHPKLLAFVSPGCELCPPVVAALPKLQRAYADLEVVAVTVSDDADAKARYSRGMRGVSSRSDLDHLLDEWSIPGTPFLVGIGSDGTVLSRGIANNLPQLEHFSEELLARDTVAMDESNNESSTPLEVAMLRASASEMPTDHLGGNRGS